MCIQMGEMKRQGNFQYCEYVGKMGVAEVEFVSKGTSLAFCFKRII